MATSVARKAAMPAGVTLVKAWGAMPPPLCGAKNEPVAVPVVPLACGSQPQVVAASAEAQQLAAATRQKPAKSFQMHIGGALHIPTKDAQELPQLEQQLASSRQQQLQGIDPFDGLPFRGFAEKLGDAIMPSLKAAREAERAAKVASFHARRYEEAEVAIPTVPHVLPFTRWAASSQKFRSTFIADPPKQRKKARMSWYHPDDTMVPRDWFHNGLLADLKYYSPFGLGGSKDTSTA